MGGSRKGYGVARNDIIQRNNREVLRKYSIGYGPSVLRNLNFLGNSLLYFPRQILEPEKPKWI